MVTSQHNQRRTSGAVSSSGGNRNRPPLQPTKNHWLRNFYLIACLAFVCFVSFRIFFSPKEITDRVRAALDRQRGQFDIQFAEAKLGLASGVIPQLAIEVKDVTFSKQQTCESRGGVATKLENQALPGARMALPAARMARLQIPFRFWRLVTGHIEAGDIEADDVMIDLDRLKEPCGPAVLPAVASAPDSVMANILDPKRVATELVPAHAWWTPAQIESLRHILSGVNFRRVQVKFETLRGGGKEVFLEHFEMQIADASQPKPLRLRSYLKIPSSMTYGETLPPISIEGDASSNHADIKLRADLSEGSIETTAELAPTENAGIKIKATATILDLPLSTTMPLFTKSGIIRRSLKPKFLWLNCGVSIAGQFQGLFENEPLHFEHCSIVGSGADIQVASATRLASGVWSPFHLKVQDLDLRKLFETFDTLGPNGIASEYGRLTGDFDFKSSKMINFRGEIAGTDLHFSNQKLRAIQTVKKMAADVQLNGSEMQARIHSVELANGKFKGELNLQGDSEFRRASVKLNVEELRLDPAVQKILVNGEIGTARGRGEALITDGRVSSVGGDWMLDSLDGHDFRLKMAQVKTKFDGDTFRVQLKAPHLTLNREGGFFTSLQPLFFMHPFADAWVDVHEPMVSAVFSKDHGIDWEKVTGSLIDGQLRFSTAGHLSDEQTLDGWISADYPRMKKLRWKLSGSVATPQLLREESKSFNDLLKRGAVTAKTLGVIEK